MDAARWVDPMLMNTREIQIKDLEEGIEKDALRAKRKTKFEQLQPSADE